MQINIGKNWVIYGLKNAHGIILAKVPEDKQGTDFDPTKLSMKYYYSTVFGAIQGAFKYGAIDSDAKSFLELENVINSIAQQCESAFNKANFN